MPTELQAGVEYTTDCRWCFTRFYISNECIKISALLAMLVLTLLMLCAMAVARAKEEGMVQPHPMTAQEAEAMAWVLSGMNKR